MSYSKNKVTSIQTLIQNFFLERLIQQRGVTSRTIESYRDTFKIYIKYLQEMFNISVENINISDFSQDKVLLFLKYLEENRNNKSITLNNRLSVIHTFMKYVAEQAPEYSNIAKKTIATVYKGNIIKNLIMDCQSYTKYRPNETTGGIFVPWRRKEELPTGA